MKSVVLHKIESELGKYIQSMTEKYIQAALKEKVHLVLVKEGRESVFGKWKQGKKLKSVYNSVFRNWVEQTDEQ